MTRLQFAFAIAAVVAIVVIFTAEILHNRAAPNKLTAPVLLFIRISLGIVFLILAVIGAVLPILQGWLFLLLAWLMFFPQSKLAVKACDRLANRMPRLIGWLRDRGIGVARDTMVK